MSKIKSVNLTLFFFLFYVLCFFSFVFTQSAPKVATLKDVKGDVQVQKAGAKSWTKATEGMKIQGGDKIKTKAKSEAKIVWDDGNIIKLSSYTDFLINKAVVDSATGTEATSTHLSIGKTFINIKKAMAPGSSFEVSTPSAICGVRSTTWSTEVTGEGTNIAVTTGKVCVSAQGVTKCAPPGYSIFIAKGQPPLEPGKTPEEKKQKEKEESEDVMGEIPNLKIDSPKDDEKTKEESIKVMGSTDKDASVTINGKVVTVNDDGIFSSDVPLEIGENTLIIEAKNSAGNAIAVTFKVTREEKEEEKGEAPSLKVEKPQDNSETDEDKTKVSGVTDADATVMINGVGGNPDAFGKFEMDITLSEGDNTIKITATNPAGKTIEITRKVKKVKKGAPPLTLSEPADGITVNQDTITVKGSTLSDANVKINGKSVKLDDAGNFSDSLTLKEGENTIEVVAARGDVTTTVTRKVTYQSKDTTPPALTISEPADGATTNLDSVTVKGTTEANVTLTINGTSASVDSNGNFSQGVSLKEGENTITIEAKDTAGNTISDLRKVTYTPKDTTPPTLTVSEPADGATTELNSITVKGTTEVGASVTINGSPVTISAGSFSQSVTIKEGDNIITIVAKDAAGNPTTVSRKVTGKDIIPPVLTVNEPIDNSTVNVNSVTVSGTTEPGAKVVVNGKSLSVSTAGSFEVSMPVVEGRNVIAIDATDLAGNKTSVMRAVTYKEPVITQLVLTVSQPTDNLITNISTVTVIGQVTPPDAKVKVQGEAVSVGGDGSFTKTITLQEGLNNLKIDAADAAGNTTPVVVRVTLDTMPPNINISQPSDNSTTNVSTVNVIGSTEAGAKVKVQGEAVSVGGDGSFTKTITLQNEGLNNLKIDAADAAGNPTSVVVRVKLDTGLPYINISQPGNNTTVCDSVITIVGTTKANAKVKVQGEAVSVGGDGSFTKTITLQEGVNSIKVEAADLAGNIAPPAIIKVTLDTIPPIIIISQPGNNTTVCDSVIPIVGTTEANAIVTIGGTTITAGSDGSFTHSMVLNEGLNNITITAKDKACPRNVSTTPLKITMVIFFLTVSEPPDGLKCSGTDPKCIGGKIKVIGFTAKDAKVTINSAPVINTTGEFTQELSLTDGTNNIRIEAKMCNNNKTEQVTKIVTYTADIDKPILTITYPTNNLNTNNPIVLVMGQTEVGAAVKVNNIAVTVNTDGGFSREVTLLEGNNTITVIATDKAGNPETKTVTVILDTTLPILTVTYPTNNLNTNNPIVVVMGQTEVGATVKVNNVAVIVNTDGGFSREVTLQGGQNTITIIATDGARNTAQVVLTVNYADVPPPPPGN